MNEGIEIDNTHTFRNFGLKMKKRHIGNAPKDEYTERVPYSSITYDFSEIYGKSYGERILSYSFEFMCSDRTTAQDNIVEILNFFHWKGRKKLCDALMPDYYFEVREPEVQWNENHGVYTIEMIFKASPEILPFDAFLKKNVILPDVNGDEAVNSIDASLIENAYINISTGKPSGLTEEQEKIADANIDGSINSIDAGLVMGFYTACSTEKYECTKDGWTRYLNDVHGKRNEVI